VKILECPYAVEDEVTEGFWYKNMKWLIARILELDFLGSNLSSSTYKLSDIQTKLHSKKQEAQLWPLTNKWSIRPLL